MSFFHAAYGVSIGQGTFTAIQGNQTNNHIYHEIVKRRRGRTIYDQFHEIMLGGVHRIRDIHCEIYPRQWDVGIRKRREEGRFRVDRTVCAAKICGEHGRFTVVSYSGPEKEKVWASVYDLSCKYQELFQAWKEDFQQFSETINTTKMQLFGINRSSVPLLIFYGELVPLAHLWDSLGQFGRSYAYTLSRDVWHCSPSEVWIDPEQGTLVRGIEGPDRDIDYVTFGDFETLPSSVELLHEDVCFRYLSRLPLDQGFDRDVIDVLHFASEIREDKPPTISRPCVLLSKTNSIIAFGSRVWNGFGCLGDQVLMPDGRTRCEVERYAQCQWLINI
ncbi:hypothetical protein E1B28_004901 [Marasmius oreades]|uniref:Uncharacterized protein n=1 Tax=Marasmius oreades TaxID=181124 RepID=A0A9P7UZM6_9AGAR|nr:uncharacterized protein E1B28_004901 [Marasmius oreades]KAG7097564.1 hypothetical protein E1B28_004901 [Marasmius oreades]